MAITLDKIQRSFYWRSSQDVTSICKPLLNRFGITYFDYSRFYSNNTCISFFSNRDYLEFFLDRKNIEYKIPPSLLTKGKYLWTSYISENFLAKANEYFNYFHGITFINPKEEYVEQYNFASDYENKRALNIYTNHSEVLETFVNYFLDKAEDLIKKAENNKIILPQTLISEARSDVVIDQEEIDKFINDLSKHKKSRKQQYPLPINNKILLFTRREIDCLKLVMLGLANKEIARELDISHRTVEIYMANLLTKTNTHNRHKLMLLAQNTPIVAA